MQNLLESSGLGNTPPELSLDEGKDCELLPVIEAILFTAARDVTLDEISAALCIPDKAKVKALVRGLADLYQSRPSGLMIRETSPDTYELSPRAEYMSKIASFMRDDLLDPNELRTLALIAYKQPIVRTQLRKLRSNATKHIPKLLELEFIHLECIDEEAVLSTTPKFAEYFGLSPDATDIKEILGAFLDKEDNG